MTRHRPQITRELLSQKQKMGTLRYVIWFVVSKMCISKNKKMLKISKWNKKHMCMNGLLVLILKGTHKNKSSGWSDPQLYCCCSKPPQQWGRWCAVWSRWPRCGWAPPSPVRLPVCHGPPFPSAAVCGGRTSRRATGSQTVRRWAGLSWSERWMGDGHSQLVIQHAQKQTGQCRCKKV